MADLARRPPIEGGFATDGVAITPEPFLGIARLQLRDAAEAEPALATALGLALPAPLRFTGDAGLGCAWLAPGEWMLTGDEARVTALLPAIRLALADRVARLTELGHARAAFLIEGRNAAALIAGHCPLDLREAAFPVGAAARSLLGAAGMMIARLDAGRYRLIVDQTMAAYALRLLARDAGTVG